MNNNEFAMQKEVVASTTPAGGGDISPAAEVATTSLASCLTVADPAVVEPPKPAELLVEARSDEITVEEWFDYELTAPEPEDATTFSIDTRGRLVITTPFDGSLELAADHVYRLHEFLLQTTTVWRPACSK